MAVIKFYEIIGEAAKNIPAEIRKLAPDIPWKNIIGFRNIVIHKYFSIDLENVWFITKKQLPALKTQIKALLKAIKNK
jgi:uncharacterized protein with HEPN domain